MIRLLVCHHSTEIKIKMYFLCSLQSRTKPVETICFQTYESVPFHLTWKKHHPSSPPFLSMLVYPFHHNNLCFSIWNKPENNIEREKGEGKVAYMSLDLKEVYTLLSCLNSFVRDCRQLAVRFLKIESNWTEQNTGLNARAYIKVSSPTHAGVINKGMCC